MCLTSPNGLDHFTIICLTHNPILELKIKDGLLTNSPIQSNGSLNSNRLMLNDAKSSLCSNRNVNTFAEQNVHVGDTKLKNKESRGNI